MEGWIKIYPKMTEWRWYKDGYTVRIFLHLLLTANIKEKPFLSTIVRRGQVLTSVRRLSEELNIPEKTVRRKLDNLKSTGEVVTESTNKWTIITICNYENYQGGKKTDDQTSDRTDDQTSDLQLKNNRYIDNISPPLSNESVPPLTGGTPIEDKKEKLSSKSNPDNTIPLPPSLESRRKRFYDSLIPFVERYGKAMIREFYDYWSEADRAAKPRMRFEKERSWETDRRLGRWARNNQKPASRPQPQQQPKPSKLDQYKEVARQLGIYQDGTEQSDNIDEQ